MSVVAVASLLSLADGFLSLDKDMLSTQLGFTSIEFFSLNLALFYQI